MIGNINYIYEKTKYEKIIRKYNERCFENSEETFK